MSSQLQSLADRGPAAINAAKASLPSSARLKRGVKSVLTGPADVAVGTLGVTGGALRQAYQAGRRRGAEALHDVSEALPSSQEVIAALPAPVTEHLPARFTPQRRRRRMPWVLGALALIAAGGVASAVLASRRRTVPEPAAAPPSLTPQT